MGEVFPARIFGGSISEVLDLSFMGAIDSGVSCRWIERSLAEIEKDAIRKAKKRMVGVFFVMTNGLCFEFDRAFKFVLIFRYNIKKTDATFQLV